MIKWIGPILALCTAASGGSITYAYTGDDFNDCNGLPAANGNCPSSFTSDYVTLSLAFSAPLTGDLSAANEVGSPNLLAWSIKDALDSAVFSSSDADATSELVTLTLSTNGSGNIDAWTVQIGDLAGGSGSEFYLFNPTIIGAGCGCSVADAVNLDYIDDADGWNAGNGTPGTFAVAAPEPSGLILVSSCLSLMLLIARWVLRKAQAPARQQGRSC
jgi:hypothetical protein